MACPTCSATMQKLGTVERPAFWCPRCGTLMEYGRAEAPKLVENVRGFVRMVTAREIVSALDAVGVLEAAYPPETRPDKRNYR